MKARLTLYFLLTLTFLQAGRGRAQTVPLPTLLTRIAGSRPDTNRVALLLEAGKYYLLKPGNEKSDLDSALSFFDPAVALSRSLHADSLVNESLKWKGDCYLEGYDLARGEVCFRLVTDYYHNTGDNRREGQTWYRLGDCIPELNGKFLDEKARVYAMARNCFQKIADTVQILNLTKQMAEEHLKANRIGLAEQELLVALAGYKEIHYPNMYYIYDLLRAVYRIKGNAEKEVFYAIEMIKSLELNHDYWRAPDFYATAAETYYMARMYDQSLLVCRKAIAYLNEKSDYYNYYSIMAVAVRYAVQDLLYKDSASAALEFFTAIIRTHPSALLWQREETLWGLGQCYAALGKYPQAEKEYAQLGTLVDSFSRSPAGFESFLKPEIVYSDYLSISHLYLLMHQYARADVYLRKIPEFPTYPVAATQRVEFELVRSEIDSGMGNYKSALQHFWSHRQLSDSLYAVDKNKQVQELQIRYETEKKDKDLGLQAGNIQLLTKQNQLQQIQSEKSTILRNVMIGGLGVLLLLVGIVYNRYQMKQRNILQLERQKVEILEKSHRLEKLLHENEWLLREVHHRVKNNLQVVMSLLNSQTAYLKDEAAFSAVMESRNRVHAMSLIHQKLYKSEKVSGIEMREYVGELMTQLHDSFDDGRHVGVALDVAPLWLDVLQAIPVGLILNEVITNAFKYAFPYSNEDRIDVRLTQCDNDLISLSIADNGRGFPPGFDEAEKGSFGLVLIRGLVEDLDGRLEIDTSSGVAYHIRFTHVQPGGHAA